MHFSSPQNTIYMVSQQNLAKNLEKYFNHKRQKDGEIWRKKLTIGLKIQIPQIWYLFQKSFQSWDLFVTDILYYKMQ